MEKRVHPEMGHSRSSATEQFCGCCENRVHPNKMPVQSHNTANHCRTFLSLGPRIPASRSWRGREEETALGTRNLLI